MDPPIEKPTPFAAVQAAHRKPRSTTDNLLATAV
jgi:hypothetical protein